MYEHADLIMAVARDRQRRFLVAAERHRLRVAVRPGRRGNGDDTRLTRTPAAPVPAILFTSVAAPDTTP